VITKDVGAMNRHGKMHQVYLNSPK